MHVSLLEGKITRNLVLFAIPIFFSQLFQTLYNTADTILIGYFSGAQSLAAMGATTALFDLIVGFCTGCGSGFGIIAGQNFGAANYKELKRTVAQSILLSLAIGLILGALALVFLPAILQLLHTPADIFDQALTYIRLIILGLLITVFYNLCAGMLRAIGDSLTPLLILALSCAINVVLDIFCILVLNMGVAGAAIATLAAQLISTLVCIVWIMKKQPLLVPGKEDFVPEAQLVWALLAQGLSMGFMSSIVSVGSVILQSAINQLGTLLIAAHTAARRMYMILAMPMFALMVALASFVAQNQGARQYDRIGQAVVSINRLAVVYCILLSGIVFLCAPWLIALLSGSREAVILEAGAMYLRINIPFFFALGILCNLRSSLQGLGYKIAPVCSSVIELIGKILFTWLIIPIFAYVGVCWCEPIIWCCMMFFLMLVWKKNDLLRSHGVVPRIL